jgi:hypothetical protein
MLENLVLSIFMYGSAPTDEQSGVPFAIISLRFQSFYLLEDEHDQNGRSPLGKRDESP